MAKRTRGEAVSGDLATSTYLRGQPTEEVKAEVEVDLNSSLQIPSHIAITKWTVADLGNSCPPIPQILDPALETAALTHPGKVKHRTDPNYERLEWIGDAYLEVIATSLIYQTFPTLEPGKCAQYREMLVRNRTLSQFSRQYGLDKRANFPEEFDLEGRLSGTTASGAKREKAQGDIFESYVGALILSDRKDGIRRASAWLKALWGPILDRHIRQEEHRVPVTTKEAISYKTQLEAAIGTKGVKIEYRDLPSTGKKDRDTNLPLVTVGCILNGWGETDKQLGFGNALGKKEAGQNAAKMALENKKLIKRYSEKKAAFTAARLAQVAAEGSLDQQTS
ncbi:ribonuclease III domain-containing protein [Lasiosphaeria miniovina]|uniref:Ribonuclease III domain-containing protein n=1 Tax=Lasiosphaeria miniovina TaxID=1954250 RepID=A0AA40A010_9PEZI|nr:ribonuclease III domain-containing protein [Lasiosphaeria miniovina]KAK0706554.1 ribonuclease III domain-containing protein [Lasiosphaeria miniovina]